MYHAVQDLLLEAFVGGRRIDDITADLPPLRLRTAGLRARGHAELEVVGIPPALADEAKTLLQVAAESAMTKGPFHAGRSWTSRLESGHLVAAFVEGSESVLRLLDPDAIDFDDPAKMAVSAVAVDHARCLRDEAPDRAERIVQNALEWFPGDVGEGYELPDGQLCNQGNSLAYLTLGTWRAAEAASLFRAALVRSVALVHAELGGPQPPRVPWASLLREVGALVEGLQRATTPARLLPSPALRLGASGLTQTLSTAGRGNRRYFYEGVVAEQLRERNVQSLVAEIYERTNAAPVEALTISRPTVHDVYAGGYRFADTMQSRPFEYASTLSNPDPIPLLSRILAGVGGDLASGLPLEACRVHWGLDEGRDRVA